MSMPEGRFRKISHVDPEDGRLRKGSAPAATEIRAKVKRSEFTTPDPCVLFGVPESQVSRHMPCLSFCVHSQELSPEQAKARARKNWSILRNNLHKVSGRKSKLEFTNLGEQKSLQPVVSVGLQMT